MNDIKVTGSIVTYNSRDKIENTISSLLENTKGVDFTLYVVDNGSQDGTAELIEKCFPGVIVIKSKNDGFGAGHNKVLPFIKSDYHLVINPDILLKEDAVTKLVKYAEKHPEAGLLSPQIRFEDGRLQMLGKKIPSLRYLAAHRFHRSEEPSKLMREYCMLDMPEGEAFEIQNATGCFMFFRTETFIELGGFDERFFMYLEDCDIARRVSKVGKKAIFYPDVTVYHLWERESKKNKKLLLIHLQSIIKYYLKWGISI